MSEIPASQADSADGTEQYEIRVKGHLAPRWSDWFDGMTLTALDDGTTVMHGTVVDQSALQGLLRKLSDIGLPLVSVVPTVLGGTPTPSTTHSNRPTQPQRSTT